MSGRCWIAVRLAGGGPYFADASTTLRRGQSTRWMKSGGAEGVRALACFLLLKKCKTCRSYFHNFSPVNNFLRDESAIFGVLPHWKFRTGCAPNIDYFLVGSVASDQPMKKIYNQCINSRTHKFSYILHFIPICSKAGADGLRYLHMTLNKHSKFRFILSLTFLCSNGFAQAARSIPATRDPKLPVLRASEPVEIIGEVVAHDGDGGMGIASVDVYGYLDILVIHVDKGLSGKIPGAYIRADFLGGTNRSLPNSLFNGKPWRMKLNPVYAVHPYQTCTTTIRPNPPPNSEEPHWWPRMIAVGGAKFFPDPNTLYCYVIERDNVQEIGAESH